MGMRPSPMSPASEMVWRAEGAHPQKPTAVFKLAEHAMHFGGGDGLFQAEREQDRRDALRQHRFGAARRTNQQDVVVYLTPNSCLWLDGRL
jgi:hypothetical protein